MWGCCGGSVGKRGEPPTFGGLPLIRHPAPSLPCRPPQDVLLQGLIAAEFLKLYGDACEARGMGLRELFISCAWPLDNPEFGKLLQQLLLVRLTRVGWALARLGCSVCPACWLVRPLAAVVPLAAA